MPRFDLCLVFSSFLKFFFSQISNYVCLLPTDLSEIHLLLFALRESTATLQLYMSRVERVELARYRSNDLKLRNWETYFLTELIDKGVAFIVSWVFLSHHKIEKKVIQDIKGWDIYNTHLFTSSNQILWECVRRRINVDFLGFYRKIFQWQSPCQSDWRLRCVTAPVSVDSQV